MVLGVLEVPVPHQCREVLEVGGDQRGREPRRFVAERIGKQEQFAGQALDRHALDPLAQSFDPDLGS